MIIEAVNGRFYEEPEFWSDVAVARVIEDRVFALFVPVENRHYTPKKCLEDFGIKGKLTYIGDAEQIFPDGTMRKCGCFHIDLRQPIPVPHKSNTYYRQPLSTEHCVVWQWAFRSEEILKIVGGVPHHFATHFLGCKPMQLKRRVLAQLALDDSWGWEQGYFLVRSKPYVHDPVNPTGTRAAL